jgi:hypothetical protein
MSLEDELMQQIVVLFAQLERLHRLAVDRNLHRPVHVGRAELRGQHQRAQAMMVACVVPQLPEACFFEEMKASALRTVSEACPHFSNACVARPVVSIAALSPVE